jgi:hypothetical protein
MKSVDGSLTEQKENGRKGRRPRKDVDDKRGNS